MWCFQLLVTSALASVEVELQINLEKVQIRVEDTMDASETAKEVCTRMLPSQHSLCSRQLRDLIDAERKGRKRFVNPQWNDAIDADAGNMSFVQIGSNCGTHACAVCGEPIWGDATYHQWPGIVIEPNPKVFHQLKANYKPYNKVLPLQLAICADDRRSTLYVDAAAPTSETASLKQPEVGEDTISFDVECLSLASLWQNYVSDHLSAVDILHIDAEKMEHDILTATDFNTLYPKPRHILYESLHLSEAQKADVKTHLSRFGYGRFLPWPGCRLEDDAHEASRGDMMSTGFPEMDTLASLLF